MANPDVLQFPELLQQDSKLLMREYNWDFRGEMCVTEASHSLWARAFRTNYKLDHIYAENTTHINTILL